MAYWKEFGKIVQELKTKIRTRIKKLLRNQKEEERLRKSLVILEKLFALPEFQNSKTVLFYASFDGEVETFEMMKQAQKLGKKIVLPIIRLKERKIIPALIHDLTEDLEAGPFGIPQPRYDKTRSLNPTDFDLVIVPGVAFDKENSRLGRGQGYYDRFLETLPRRIPTIGLAFDFQVVDRLPHQAHDVSVSYVMSN